uniref:Uncharacterized protein n=1 Tax=Romanomermis culicivorax TaxID=13658 RepID=A0A915KFR9_ROMCU
NYVAETRKLISREIKIRYNVATNLLILLIYGKYVLGTPFILNKADKGEIFGEDLFMTLLKIQDFRELGIEVRNRSRRSGVKLKLQARDDQLPGNKTLFFIVFPYFFFLIIIPSIIPWCARLYFFVACYLDQV